MSYTVVFGREGRTQAADVATARQALIIVRALRNRDEVIKFITSPQEGEIGVEMLKVLAREEEEEMPMAIG